MGNIYRISHATGEKRIPTFVKYEEVSGGVRRLSQHSSSLYLKGLQAIREVAIMTAPDIYQHDIAYQVADLPKGVVHVTDKPIHLLRPLFGRINVAIAMWDAAQWGSEDSDGDPRTNHLHMLRRMDEIWCRSSLVQGSLAAAGISARFLPPPIAHFNNHEEDALSDIPCNRLGIEGSASQSLDVEGFFESSAGATVFLTIMSASEIDEVRPLIEGFLVSDAAKNSFFLIKFNDDGAAGSGTNIKATFAAYVNMSKCERVIWCDADLSDEQINRLYGLSTFFVSLSSSGDGINAPLVAAMARGMAVIAPDHPAMGDYIADERSIVVPTTGLSRTIVDDAQSGKREATHYEVTSAALSAAFDRAVTLSVSDRSELGARGAALVNAVYGLNAFERGVTEFESSIA